MIVAGIGCRKGSTDGALHSALSAALSQHGLSLADVSALATGGMKAREEAILAAATRLGIPLTSVEDPALRAVADRCLTRSAFSLEHSGLPSLSEAAAIAAAGDNAQLLGPRLVLNGVTCALARPGERS